jgi:osmotically-inducible protein OsmY
MMNIETLKRSVFLACASTAAAIVVVANTGCAPLVVGGVAVAAVSMAEDRRSSGTFIDDEGIENRSTLNVKNKFGSQVHVNITSVNRNVLISGEAATEAVKQGVEAEVRAAGKVSQIYNELVVGPSASVLSVSNDTRLTGVVKTRFLESSKFQINHVKVVTEAKTVFLMGIVTRAEAEAASQIASTTSGVQRVVRLFEYKD